MHSKADDMANLV